MEPQWNHDGRAKSGRMNGRWKVLFGRWKGDGIVVVAAPTSACVSSRLVRPTRRSGRRSRLDRRACATQAEACASMSAPAYGACADDGGGLCAISIRWRRASRQTRLCRRGCGVSLKYQQICYVLYLVMRLEPPDGRGREPASILAEQCDQRLLEITGGDALQVENRDQHL